ncbi:glucuronate isomerase, partial [Escherichia coli]
NLLPKTILYCLNPRDNEVLGTMIGNPKGEDQPNKKYYDPRVWLRAGQTSMIARLEKAFQELNAIDVL